MYTVIAVRSPGVFPGMANFSIYIYVSYRKKAKQKPIITKILIENLSKFLLVASNKCVNNNLFPST